MSKLERDLNSWNKTHCIFNIDRERLFYFISKNTFNKHTDFPVWKLFEPCSDIKGYFIVKRVICHDTDLLVEEYYSGTLAELYERLPMAILLKRYQIEEEK